MVENSVDITKEIESRTAIQSNHTTLGYIDTEDIYRNICTSMIIAVLTWWLRKESMQIPINRNR